MYRSPRMVDVPVKVDLPSVMYQSPLFNVIGGSDAGGVSQTLPASKSCPETSILEARQEAVLKRLEKLKEQLDHLQSTRTTTTTATTATTTTTTALGAAAHSSPTKPPGSPIQDLVISASPQTPPLSLLLLRHLLRQAGLPVHSSSRVHSSVAQVCREVQEAFTDSPLGERSKHSLAFSLQWKNVQTPNLMVNPLRQTKIEGEANILRYIARLFPATSPINYEATGTYRDIAEVDQTLDEVEKECRLVGGGGGGAKGRQTVLKLISSRLAKTPYLCGQECGLADVLTWSLLRQGGQEVRSGQEVVRWMAKMDDLTGMDLASLVPHQQQQQQKQQQKQPAQAAKTAQPPKTAETKVVTAVQPSAPQGDKQLKGRKELEEFLKKLGISYKVKEHKEVFTVEELMKQVEGLPGVVTKNLFLRDKKKKLYLLSTKHDTEIDLKTIAKKIGTKDLRFADESILLDTLGVRQGCVSALALFNDASPHVVQFLVEGSALDPSVPYIYFHPMTNAATLGLTPSDLGKFLAATGHSPTSVTF